MSVNHEPHLIKTIEKLNTDAVYSDITLVAEDKKFPVHRIILGAQSEFFHKMFFDNQCKEANEDEIAIEAPADILDGIIKYLYSGKIDLENMQMFNILETLELCRRYLLENLENAIIDHVARIMTNEDLPLVIKFAELLDSKELSAGCAKLISEGGGEFLISENGQKLTDREIKLICSHPGLKVMQFVKFQAIEKWIKHQLTCPADTTDHLLKSVDLNLLSNRQLANVEKSGLYEIKVLWDVMTARGMTDVGEEIVTVDNETKIIQYENIAERGCKIVTGTGSEHILGDTDFVSSERINNDYHIVVDLGGIFSFNYITLNVGDDIQSFRIRSSTINRFELGRLDGMIWKEIGHYQNRRCAQDIFFEKTTARFLYFQSLKQFNGFKIMYMHETPPLHKNILMPKKNICTPENSKLIIKKASGVSLLSWDHIKIGKDHFSGTTISFIFNQPYFLTKCRILVHGSHQTFDLRANGKAMNLKTFAKVDGWQVFEIPPKIYTGLEIVSGNKTVKTLVQGQEHYRFQTVTDISLVYFEAFA